MSLGSNAIAIGGRYKQTSTANSGAVVSEDFRLTDLSITFASGTLANQADRPISRAPTAATGSESIILSAYTDAFGAAKAMVDVVAVVLVNTGTVDITIGPDTTNGWTALFAATTTLKPGEATVHVRPTDPAWAVTAGSNDRLKLNVPTGTGAYEFFLLGRSA